MYYIRLDINVTVCWAQIFEVKKRSYCQWHRVEIYKNIKVEIAVECMFEKLHFQGRKIDYAFVHANKHGSYRCIYNVVHADDILTDYVRRYSQRLR